MSHGQGPDPDALLARFRATGAPADLGALFDATAADLFRVAAATAPDAAAAEDAVQETFLAVISAAARWDPARRAMPWLLGILRFKVAHERARRGRSGASLPDLPADAEGAPATALDAAEAARAWAEIDTLEEPYRSVTLLRWRYGLSPAEIAHVRGEAPGTTRSLLSRALERVRRSSRVAPAVLVPAPRDGRGLASVREAVVRAAARARPLPVLAVPAARTLVALLGALVVVGGGALLLPGLRADRRGDTGGSPARAPGETPVEGEPPAGLAARSAGTPPTTPAIVPRATARGRVVDEEGRPVAGARVTSVPRESREFVRPTGSGGSPISGNGARTDADGRFEVGLTEGEPAHELLVDADARGIVVAGPVRVGSDTTIVLAPGARWDGRVVDPAGRPVVGARVSALVLCSWFRLEPSVTTDPAGRFAFEGMPARTASLRLVAAWIEASAEGFAPTTVKPQVRPGDPPRDVEIVLRRGSRWSGRVLDGDTGRPVPGARVTLESTEARYGISTELDEARGMAPRRSPFGERLVAEATSDSEGRWAIDHAPSHGDSPPGEVEQRLRPFVGRFTARAEGYAPWVEVPRRAGDGQDASLDFVLWHGASVTGRIVGADGRGLADARGLVGTTAPVAQAVPFVADAQGRYRVDGLSAPSEAGTDATVRLVNVHGAPTVTVRVRPGETVPAPDLVAPADDSIPVAVRVVTEAGAGIERAIVSWTRHSLRGGVTDHEGRATLQVPRRALERFPEVEIRAWGEGWARGAVRRKREDLGTGEIRLVLAEGRTLAGRVTWADGRPVPGAYVTAVPVAPPPPPLEGEDPEPPPPLGVFSDADGSFRHVDLPDGEWTLSTSAPSRQARADAPTARLAPVRAGAEDVVLRFEANGWDPGVRVTGTVVDAGTGAPVRQASVLWRRATALVPVQATAEGTFEVELPAGRWEVTVTSPGYRRSVRELVVDAADPAPRRVDVGLSRGAVITGSVSGVAFEGDAPRELWFHGTASGAVAPVDPDGRYRVSGLEPGTYLCSWGYPSVPDAGPVKAFASPTLLEVTEADATIDVRLVRAGALSATTDDPSLPLMGRPPAESSPEARARAAESRWVVQDATGRALFTRPWAMRGREGGVDRLVLPPGRYRVLLERPGEAPVALDVDVAEGEHVRRTLGGP